MSNLLRLFSIPAIVFSGIFTKNKFDHQKIIDNHSKIIKKSTTQRDFMECDKAYNFYINHRNSLPWYKRNFGI